MHAYQYMYVRGQLPLTATIGAGPSASAAVNGDSDGGGGSRGCPGAIHTVVPGDTCHLLARQYGTDGDTLHELNPGLDCSGGLRPGQVLCVTANATAGTTGGGS